MQENSNESNQNKENVRDNQEFGQDTPMRKKKS
jgi:hypothetical protein